MLFAHQLTGCQMTRHKPITLFAHQLTGCQKTQHKPVLSCLLISWPVLCCLLSLPKWSELSGYKCPSKRSTAVARNWPWHRPSSCSICPQVSWRSPWQRCPHAASDLCDSPSLSSSPPPVKNKTNSTIDRTSITQVFQIHQSSGTTAECKM